VAVGKLSREVWDDILQQKKNGRKTNGDKEKMTLVFW